MKQLITAFCLLLWAGSLQAQKKPLDHSVYDSWQSISERMLSNDGKFLAFAVNPQEGDGVLYLQSVQGDAKLAIPRGYSAQFSDNSQYLVLRIKPSFKETRDARVKKKRPDEMPKDTLCYVSLNSMKTVKIPRLKSYKLPDDSGIWLACLLEKSLPDLSPRAKAELDSAARIKQIFAAADSVLRIADSIRLKGMEAKMKGMSVLQPKREARPASAAPKAAEDPFEEGTDLLLINMETGKQEIYKLVTEYFFNIKGTSLLMETSKKTGDASVKATVQKLELSNLSKKTIFQSFNDAKGYRMDEEGKQLAFVAERDSAAKALQKFYKLYYYKDGMDSASMIADNNIKGLPAKQGISENAQMSFSKSGKHLFFGTAPILPVKDTTLPDFERVSVDVWHYNDDYLQPQQLRNLEFELRKSFAARYDFDKKEMVSLANPAYRNLILTKEGDGAIAYAIADGGKRVAAQWQGFTLNDLIAVDPITGATSLIQKDFKGNVFPSYTGKFLLQYDERKKQYNAYDAEKKATVRVAKDITFPLYDVDNDVPDDPNAYGVMGWLENDAAVFIYDQYDIWQVDPTGSKASICITGGLGRKNKISYRNIVLDREEKFIKAGQQFLFGSFNETTKGSGLQWHTLGTNFQPSATYPVRLSAAIKAKDAAVLSFGAETYAHASDIRVVPATEQFADAKNLPGKPLFQPNAQQANYNWGTAELFKWKAYTGKETEGIVYKPEDFDPKKKYPMIVYFYERSSDGLYSYQAPAPTPSRLNIPFFVSRGYIVFVPDIWYKTGYPGQGAYDHILSGTRAVVKQGYVDSTKIGLQGQSWGGYQIVYLITKTNLYAAAWAGAPVANMTSAYGGIRWGTGLNRQFQYEKTQSRIGATLWEKPNLYLENSALFSLPKVKTPLVIMHNDADDAVPWYQGIEMFTGLRRLGKPVWMLNYNNEAHNLIERKNRKDIQIREQQFFDYLLKGEKPAKWIADGVPAVLKGRDWGLGY